ncbi:YciI family protein [Salinibacterium sp. ZJ450]|uniref:YciI family protein n=1 Tax=Salinibacterium sp. ZJ450 TaxID=2708338 RepID=UPI0014222B11|nr:YciI family protein [Salinibacterium sp. ZJ450]
MRYTLLMHYPEMTEAELGAEAMAEGKKAFDIYAKDLHNSGVLLSADVLQPSSTTTTVSSREGTLKVQDGPFADSKEQLGGTFVIDVPDLDAALSWAEKCPAAEYGVIEVRPSAIVFHDGQWEGQHD